MARLAIIDRDRCKPNECGHECERFCPGVRMGNETVIFNEEGNPIISEILCSGCGICVKKCPYKAITIINLPEELESALTHRYGPNGFKLFRLPIVKSGGVLGLIGPNGTGKSTALKILANQITPNLGNYENPPAIKEVIEFFKGTELQNFFKAVAENKLTVAYKPQYVTKLPEVVKGTVGELLQRSDQRNKLEELKKQLDLGKIWSRELRHLSGGELQKVAVTATIIRDSDLYLFDEPTSYLDVRERLELSRAIRGLVESGKTVVVVEHDLAALDYLSDYVSMFYGSPGNYGVVSHPHGVRVGINIFLNGFIPDENMRFREQAIHFQPTPGPPPDWVGGRELIRFYPMEKRFEGFSLKTTKGMLYAGEVVGILGPNGIGKTTFVKMIAGILEPDKGKPPEYIGAPDSTEENEKIDT
ncbi:MAG: ribosome biogenesis/translation initiation ATPase RLI, partial [Candidatus Ranarchaeia archaeon]